MKGKTLTGIVLVVEIASIAILHAVKINHTEKTAKEFSRSQPAAEAMDNRAKPAITLAVLK
ncbi:MAG TPA: hypothetical protein VHE34_10695 [Puia sp.]|uniref:hypothetical protein n=1 Tax=Puia sp. TaxID=2045100 RepID=UPI002CD0BFDB|nr:hypothetical protein [Puia sp.]HVU95684.1 hypothetical protein [Puia sp.]